MELKDLKFIESINVGVLRKIEPIIRKFEKWEIWELDLLALSFNYYLKDESKFENNNDAENFIDSLEIDQIWELSEILTKIKENSNKKK